MSVKCEFLSVLSYPKFLLSLFLLFCYRIFGNIFTVHIRFYVFSVLVVLV